MRTLYFDCFAGISGDMTIGALLDAGVRFEDLREQLGTVPLRDYKISAERVMRGSLAATKFNVAFQEAEHHERHLSDIAEMVERSQLSAKTKARATQIFEKLAAAEAQVHGKTIEEVHFHEVGAVDSIIDIVGAAICSELLGIERFVCSPLRVGYGSIQAAHGTLPIPAPGTAEILRGTPIYAGDREGEFVTPTGAAIVASLCDSFSTMPPIEFDTIGYGAGTRNPKDFPNVLRVICGKAIDEQADNKMTGQQLPERYISGNIEAQLIQVIETNIDDMNPQSYGFIMDKAFALGALDVFLTPVQMKKNRPGVLLTVLCKEGQFAALIDLLLTETTTLGVRYYQAHRRILEREIEMVQTEFGEVRIKIARQGERILHFQPEFDDCAQVAERTGVSLLDVQQAAIAAYRKAIEK
jgi:uncharacterized protein (TIGR00299 family) protein